jgi:hypothetical protein
MQAASRRPIEKGPTECIIMYTMAAECATIAPSENAQAAGPHAGLLTLRSIIQALAQ